MMIPATSQPAAIGRGMAMALLCYFLLTVMDALIKELTAGYSLPQIVFLRTLFGFGPIAFAVYRAGGLAQLRTRNLPGHLARGTIGCAAGFLFFYSFSVMPLADSYAIAFAAPLFITALGVPMLGERVDAGRWAAVLVGFAAILFMLREQVSASGLLTLGGAAALAGAACYATTVTYMRRQSRTETNAAIMVYGSGAGLLISGALLPFGHWTPMPLADFGLMVAVGGVGGLASLCMTQAFRLAPAAVVAPFEYTAMVWAVLFGYWLWGDVPSSTIVAGSLVIVACGLYSLHRETRLARPEAA